MINESMLIKNYVYHVPYVWAEINHYILLEYAQRLYSTFPNKSFFSPCEANRKDKSYKMYVRPVINTSSNICDLNNLSEEWKTLIHILWSPYYQKRIERFLDLSLRDCDIEINFWIYNTGNWLSPHIDKEEKIVTQLFYFNPIWKKEWGGFLRILNNSNEDDFVAEIPPLIGKTVLLVRNDHSWHAVSHQYSPSEVKRYVLQLVYTKELKIK